MTLRNSAGGEIVLHICLIFNWYIVQLICMVHTGDRWVSGAGSQVDSSMLARSSLRLGSMSGLGDVGRWP
jgi:hypothetical protein